MLNRYTTAIPLYEEGIVFEILKHLPSKSLLRFMCVSKNWFRIIQSNYFVDCHRSCSHTRPGGIQLVYVMDSAFGSCFLSDPEGNSQFCFDNSSLPDVTSRSNRISYAEALICFGNHIWNPSTRESMDIDIPHVQLPCYSWDYLLGFDASTNRYKVLCILNRRAPIVNHKKRALVPLLQVFTLGGGNCWKPIPVMPDEICEGFDILSSRSFSNMIFCMIRCGRCGIKLRLDCFGVLTFDVRHEHVGFISIPSMFKFDTADLERLADIEGRLAFMSSVEPTLWVLDHKIGQWTKMEITFEGHCPCNPCFGYVTDGIDYVLAKCIAIGTIQTDEILFQCEDKTKSQLKFLYYDPVTKKIRFVPKLEKTVDAIRDFVMIKHVDSIVRLTPPTQKE